MADNDNLYRLSAFTTDPAGGNPAGVWIGDVLPDSDTMQRIAAEVGYSETAFIAPRAGLARTVRYFSPLAEVPFCGHATIATGVQLGRMDGAGLYHLASAVGDIRLKVSVAGSQWKATLTSVDTRYRPVEPELLDAVLATLNWQRAELSSEIPPAAAYAGAWHLVLAVASLQRLQRLDYSFEALQTLMLQNELTTLQLVWRENGAVFHSRNPFPVGGIIEDPATGAAAAALGGYLRDAGLARAPFNFDIRQGEAMGRPSLLRVSVPARGGIAVTGTAVAISRLTPNASNTP